MLDKLEALMPDIENLLDDKNGWNSLVINRRRPITYRIFRQHPVFDKYRICLHKFDPCHQHEALLHPHPWPGAFIILKGRYLMELGRSDDRFLKPNHVSTLEMVTGSAYEITDPLTWHSVIPLETTFTIMLNSEPWTKDVAHRDVRTTKGKDLDSLLDSEEESYIDFFKILVRDWIVKNN